MIKYIITIAIVYFIVRSIATKPWLEHKKAKVHQSKSPESQPKEPKSQDLEGDFVEYEEVD